MSNENESLVKDEIATQPKLSLKQKIKRIDKLVSIGIFLIGMFSLGWMTANYFNTPKIATFDIKETTNTFMQQVSSLSLDEAHKETMVKRYQKTLENILREYEDMNYVIFVKPAVVSNVEDKTREIQQKIAKRMKSKDIE